jgi:hypothetical protein
MMVGFFLQCFATCCLVALIIGYVVFLFQDSIKPSVKDVVLPILEGYFKILAIVFMGFLIYAIWFIR